MSVARRLHDSKTSAVFRDITVRNVSVEETRGKNSSIKVQKVPDKGFFHERLTFENVTFRDVNPAHLDGLKDSVFRDVIFERVNGGSEPWKPGENKDLIFEGSTRNQEASSQGALNKCHIKEIVCRVLWEQMKPSDKDKNRLDRNVLNHL